MKLTDLNIGEEGIIVKVSHEGELKKRLTDIGVTAGELINFKRSAPLGDPKQYSIRGCSIALRAVDAEKIIIKIRSESYENHK